MSAGQTRVGQGFAPSGTVYLSGSTNPWVEDAAQLAWGELGLLVQPGNGTSYLRRLDRFPVWAADNGCFAQGDGFDAAAWFRWLTEVPEVAPRESYLHDLHGSGGEWEVRETCLFATAPDVVGDAAATLERSRPWLPKIRGLGYPAAFVGQDGCEADGFRLVPWDDFDVMFLGGSTDWKLDTARAGAVTAEARRRGKPVHMGRVNSRKRFDLAHAWGCASADGNFLTFGALANLPQAMGWFDAQEGVATRRQTWELERVECGEAIGRQPRKHADEPQGVTPPAVSEKALDNATTQA